MHKKIIIIGAGVAGINAATKLVDNGYPGELITIIDKGQDPYNRKHEEVMEGMLGAGGWSDGKLTYHTAIGGQLKKYCGEDKAMELMNQVVENFKRFHPCPEIIMKSDPQEEPEFIKPHFGLRLFPVWHIGSDYLHEIGKAWYKFLLKKGVNFHWGTEIFDIDFLMSNIWCKNEKSFRLSYEELIFAVGKSGIDFSQKLIEQYNLDTEPKSVQIGVRFEAPQKYFQKLIDISYDFKLYQKFDSVSLRSFCTNNNAAYVAVEETYGDVSYNGHALKDEKYLNQMTNFGILMEIKGIDNPFEWCRNVVRQVQAGITNTPDPINFKTTGLYYSPNNTRKPSQTSEGSTVNAISIPNLDIFKEAFGEYADYVINFIDKMNEVFKFGDDWGMYIPEVKYLSPEPLINHSDLSLKQYTNVHFVGDALSARGITVSGAQGIYVAESLLK
jgi:uncharacterized FAD-dependent dehydrogenase